MDVEGTDLTFKDLLSPPPLMPWREFANWIRMSNEHNTVWGWIRNGYIPSRKVGKHVMVNVALLTRELLDKERTPMSTDTSLDLCSVKNCVEMGGAGMDAATALSYLGQTVLMELGWDDCPVPIWRCLHVLGVVLPKEGVYDHGHFMVINALNPEEFLQEIFWDDIRTLQSVHLRTEFQASCLA